MASIRERVSKDGTSTSYAVLYNEGKRQRSKTFAKRADAVKFRALVDALGPADAIAVGQRANANASNGPTVSDVGKEWLAYKKRDMTTEAHRDYERQFKKWIEPTFGWRDAETITERDVQHWVDTVLAPSLGGKSVAGKHALLHGLYAWASAKTRGIVTHNPCKETDLPDRDEQEVRGLSLDELHTLLDAAAKSKMPDAALVIATIAGTGWRPGEVLAPTARHLEVDSSGAVFLTMGQVFRRGEGIVKGGKTDAALRRLQVLGVAADDLPDRLIGRAPGDLLFPNPITGGPWNPTSFRRNYWQPIIEKAKLEDRGPTPYWLRHTHVLVCHAAGLTLPEIQRRLGHKSIQTTINVYGKLIGGMTPESAARLDALLRPAPPHLTVVRGQIVE